MTKTPCGSNQSQAFGEDGLFLSLEHSDFEFVSDFEIRISNLTSGEMPIAEAKRAAPRTNASAPATKKARPTRNKISVVVPTNFYLSSQSLHGSSNDQGSQIKRDDKGNQLPSPS